MRFDYCPRRSTAQLLRPGVVLIQSLKVSSSPCFKLPEYVILRIGQLGQHGHDAVIGDDGQVLLVLGDVGDGGADRTLSY